MPRPENTPPAASLRLDPAKILESLVETADALRIEGFELVAQRVERFALQLGPELLVVERELMARGAK